MGNKPSSSASSPSPNPPSSRTNSDVDAQIEADAAAAAAIAAASEDAAVASGAQTEGERMNVLQLLRHGYGQIVNALIRPPRAEYELSELGPLEFDFRGRRFIRTDLELRNPRGLKLQCSWWQPHADDRPAPQLPCVIALHGNAGCRLAARENIDVVLGEGCSYFAFDFSGSGLSDGAYVTLGFHEKEDLACVMEYLRGSGSVSTIACWGRSMGAATALLHSHRDPSIAGLILDSSFCDLHRLTKELAVSGATATGFRVPTFVIGTALRLIRSSVLKKSGLDIFNLRPIDDVDKAFIPALFCYGEEDAFIPPQHTKDLYAKYSGDKNIIGVPGDHNSPRPTFFLDSAAIFLRAVLRIPEDAGWALVDPRAESVVSPSTQQQQRQRRRPDAAPRAQHATVLEAWLAAAAMTGGGGSSGSGSGGSGSAAPRSRSGSAASTGIRDAAAFRQALALEAADEEMLQRAIEASLLTASADSTAVVSRKHSRKKNGSSSGNGGGGGGSESKEDVGSSGGSGRRRSSASSGSRYSDVAPASAPTSSGGAASSSSAARRRTSSDASAEVEAAAVLGTAPHRVRVVRQQHPHSHAGDADFGTAAAVPMLASSGGSAGMRRISGSEWEGAASILHASSASAAPAPITVVSSSRGGGGRGGRSPVNPGMAAVTAGSGAVKPGSRSSSRASSRCSIDEDEDGPMPWVRSRSGSRSSTHSGSGNANAGGSGGGGKISGGRSGSGSGSASASKKGDDEKKTKAKKAPSGSAAGAASAFAAAAAAPGLARVPSDGSELPFDDEFEESKKSDEEDIEAQRLMLALSLSIAQGEGAAGNGR